MMPFLLSAWGVVVELAPWLLVGAAVAGVLHATLPPGLVERQLRGRWGVVKAVAVGVPLPLCSCGVIPAGLGLRRQGASQGAAVGFLVSTPQTGVDSVLVSASFLGWPFALFKVASALVLGVVGGYATEAVSHAAEAPGAGAAAPAATPLPGGLGARVRRGSEHAVMLVRMIWRWIVFGVVVSAGISTLLPPDAFVGFAASGGALALGAVLAVSLPLYVCATASVPIAAALVAQGFPTGAALVFLMAGPATNVATVGAVHRAFGMRVLVVYLATLVVGSLAAGLLFDSVLPGAGSLAAEMGHSHGAAPVAVAAAVTLLLAIAWFALDDARGWLRVRRAARRTAPGGAGTVELGVEGMSCQGCARKVRGALAAVPGVEDVDVALDPGLARVRGRVDVERLQAAVREAGFAPGERDSLQRATS